MTSTLEHRKSAPLSLGGSLNAFEDDDSADSLGSSIPEFLNLRVVLPDGTEKITQVNSSKQMLDLAIQLAASNRLSPANHTLAVYHPETGRQISYKASQMIGSLRIETVHLVNKKANKDKSKRHTVAMGQDAPPPFEITNRITVNLPKNQKTYIRINLGSTLADIFKMVCTDKGLDPYKHELRHPTQPDIALNMASPLSTYKINEITVVNVTAADQPSHHTSSKIKPGSGTTSIYDSHWTYNNMPRKKGDTQGPPAGEQAQQESFMPGMTEKRKKKGIMSLFSRKKEGKFKLGESSYTPPPASVPPPTYDQSVTNGNKPQAEVKPQPQKPPPELEDQKQTSSTSLKVAPTKPNRKKRQAPAPPGGTKPLEVNTDSVSMVTHIKQVHSRGSSHSSGFDETNLSPLESPGASSGNSSHNTRDSGQTKSSLEATSIDSSGLHIGNGRVKSGHVTIEEAVLSVSSAGNTSTVSRQSSMSTGADSSTCSLPRGKKKRKAPPPPTPGGPKPSSTTSSPTHNPPSPSHSGHPPSDGSAHNSPSHSNHSPSEGAISAGSSTAVSPVHEPLIASTPKSPVMVDNLDGEEDQLNMQELHLAIAEELKKEVSSCDSDVPDTPGESSTDFSVIGADTENVNVETVKQGLLERQKSDVAVFVDQMTQLTDNVRRDSDTSPNQDSEQPTNTDLHTDPTFTDDPEIHVHTTVVEVTYEPDFSKEEQIVPVHDESRRETFDFAQIQALSDREQIRAKSPTSDSSSEVGSLSKYDIHEVVSESDDENHKSVLPDADQNVILVKKKIVPDFSFEEDALGDDIDDDITDHMIISHEPRGPADVAAALTSFDKIKEVEEEESQDDVNHYIEPYVQVNYNPTKASIVPNHDQVQFQDSDEWTDSGRESPLRGQVARQGSSSGIETLACDEEITFDHLEVEYVIPHQPSQDDSVGEVHAELHDSKSAQNYQLTNNFISNVESEQEVPQPTTINPSHEVIVKSYSTSEAMPDQVVMSTDSVSPPSRSSLYSIIKHSKSDKDQKKHVPKTTESVDDIPESSHHMFLFETKQTENKQNYSQYDHNSSETLQTHLEQHVPETVPIEQEMHYQEPVLKKAAVYHGTVSDEESESSEKHDEEENHEREITVASTEDIHREEILKEPEPPPKPVEQPVFKSLRDAYRSQQQQKAPEVIIIPKPTPYKIPPVGKKYTSSSGSSLPRDPSDASRMSAIREAKTPSGVKTKPVTEESHAPPPAVVYKTESLAVSRKAPKLTGMDPRDKHVSHTDKEQDTQTVFWGPRPWSARSASDKEQITATHTGPGHMQSNTANITHHATTQPHPQYVTPRKETDPQHVTLRKEPNPQNVTPHKEPDPQHVTPHKERPNSQYVTPRQEPDPQHVTPHKERPNSVIGMYSPGKPPSVEASPKEISFSPKGEEEDGQHMLEDKSITMLAYPVERKSILKSSVDVQSASRPHSSAEYEDVAHPKESKPDYRIYNSSMGLSEVGKEKEQSQPVQPIIRNIGQNSNENEADTKEKAKRSLQQQYNDLQSQFSKWQKQLSDNQVLLTQKRLIPVEENHQQPQEHETISHNKPVIHGVGLHQQPQEPETISHNKPVQHGVMPHQYSLGALEQKKAAENYQRLSTPRPFQTRSLDQKGFQPNPIIKKRWSLNEKLASASVFNNTNGGEPKKPFEDLNIQHSNSGDILHTHEFLQHPKTESLFKTSVGADIGVMRSLSVGTSVRSPSPEPVLHKTLTSSKSEPPSKNNKSRFEPKLDPREELMIAIRNAGGRNTLQKVSCVDTNW